MSGGGESVGCAVQNLIPNTWGCKAYSILGQHAGNSPPPSIHAGKNPLEAFKCCAIVRPSPHRRRPPVAWPSDPRQCPLCLHYYRHGHHGRIVFTPPANQRGAAGALFYRRPGPAGDPGEDNSGAACGVRPHQAL